MPELPEVEALAAYLDSKMAGRTIAAVDVVAVSVLKTFQPSPADLEGRSVLSVSRIGKYLDFRSDGAHLVLHLARAGWVRWRDEIRAARPRGGPLALRVRLDEGDGIEVTEAGTQKRLAAWVVASPEQVPGVARLGPDPLSEGFTVADLAERLRATSSQLKGALTDQALVAGVGNAYSDEALHAARMSPFRSARTLTDDEVRLLYESLRAVLGDAVDRSRDLPAAGLKDEKRAGMRVHGRTGLPCPVCGDTVREVSFADRSLQYCPTCQTGGRVLADRRLSRLLR
ncbi:MAG TPA: DNA-formamidopyrimidine glycosylase family protein [Acidimicrobiales bacterium]|nr:DNA-formamidopyrimidine glycosylase family protein [Acidimicrobiales bacterium]